MNVETMTTLRRRVTDKLCKDEAFLQSVVGLAIEEGAIKHTDILSGKEVREVLGAPTTNGN